MSKETQKFKTSATTSNTEQDILSVLRRWGVSTKAADGFDIITSRATQSAELRFKKEGLEVRIVSRGQSRIADNLRLCYLTLHRAFLDDVRGVQSWKVALRQSIPALMGSTAGDSTASPDDPWVVLGLQPGAPRAVVQAVFHALARQHHPDTGGDRERFQQIGAAYQTIIKDLGGEG